MGVLSVLGNFTSLLFDTFYFLEAASDTKLLGSSLTIGCEFSSILRKIESPLIF